MPYLCKTCRVELFCKEDIETHTSKTAKKFSKRKSEDTQNCSSLFIRKMEWMGDCEENSGKLVCKYCLMKLGEYKWAGRQCSCGKFVTPAFQIHMSSVDPQSVAESYISNPKKWE